VLLTANRRAFSAFDGVNSVFRGGGYAAAGVTNASEVSSLWDFADAALIWSPPVSRKRTPGALGAWGVVAST
jgi:hypothetical protein